MKKLILTEDVLGSDGKIVLREGTQFEVIETKITENEDVLATLHFNVSTSQGRDDLLLATQARNLHRAIDGLYDCVFRPNIKYGKSFLNENEEAGAFECKVVEAVWKHVHKFLEENGHYLKLENE